MAKAIGLSRKIKLQWLNKAVDLLGENLTEEEYKAKMNEYLSFEIESPTVLRKTREILMRVWFYEDDVDVIAIRKDALDLIKKYPDYDVAIHWCMLLVVYPVFADLSRLIGRIVEFNDVITLSQLKQKLYDEWGERSTLYHSTDKIIATIKELGVITSDKPGNYTIVKITVTRSSVLNFMLRVAMKVCGKSYYSFSELDDINVLFPFDYIITKEALINDTTFIIQTLGRELTVALR
ncbi:MAG: hypothetical protein IJL46_07205 [Clostridia bacterium]|nr:hypothetical protein [Clostridia bacterium]MBQ5957338.1 hypothetical protein [Clostridia bacterium]